MAETCIVVDSDILIDVSRGIEQAIQIIEEFEHTNKLCISVITQLKLMVGCNNKKRIQRIRDFFRMG